MMVMKKMMYAKMQSLGRWSRDGEAEHKNSECFAHFIQAAPSSPRPLLLSLDDTAAGGKRQARNRIKQPLRRPVVVVALATLVNKYMARFTC